MDGRFLTKLLCQVVESFQPADLVEQPLLVALLRPLQVPPGLVDVLQRQWKRLSDSGKLRYPTGEAESGTHRDHLALGGHEGGPVAQSQFGLQGVEVDLQLALLLHLGRLVEAAVISEVLQLLLHGLHGVLRHAVLQPGDGATDPLQQLQRARVCVCVCVCGSGQNMRAKKKTKLKETHADIQG